MGGMAMQGPGAGGALPDRHPGDAGDARLGQLRRRVLHPQRPLRLEDRLRLRRDQRRGDVAPTTPCASTSARCTTASRDVAGVAGDRLARRARARSPGPLHPWPGALPTVDPEADRCIGGQVCSGNGSGAVGGSPKTQARTEGKSSLACAGGDACSVFGRPPDGSFTKRIWPVNFHAPEIDYAALSPVLALTVRALHRPAFGGVQAPATDSSVLEPLHLGRHRRAPDLALERPADAGLGCIAAR